MRRAPVGGKGSNQYQSKPGGLGSGAGDAGRRASIEAALETEAAAAVFGSPAPDLSGSGGVDQRMVRVAVSGTLRQRWDLIRDPGCPTVILEWVAARDPDAEVWGAAAHRLDPERWAGFNPEGTAGNPDTPVEVLDRLATDPDRMVRAAVGWNEATTPETLTLLARDPDINVRLGVAQNPSCPPVVQDRLAGDGHWQVRLALAANEMTDPRLIQHLSTDPKKTVRAAALANRSHPKS